MSFVVVTGCVTLQFLLRHIACELNEHQHAKCEPCCHWDV
jgi:hypothetical protein